MSEYAWVELNDGGEPVRIFRTRKAAYAFGKMWIECWWRGDAVKAIRHKVFLRSKGYCEFCEAPVIEPSGHLHEKIHRGKGGEISLENSVFICPSCHADAHSDRNPRWSKKPSINGGV